MSSQSSTNTWQTSFGPNRVKKASPPSSGALFYFFAKDNDLDQLWPTIVYLTEKGLLGYYSSRSEDGEVVCIHYSDAKDLDQKEFISNVLKRLDINEFKWKTRWEANGCQFLVNSLQNINLQEIEEANDSSNNQPIGAINPFATLEADISTDNNRE